MAYILCYTKPGTGTYPDSNYPGHVGYLCDWEQAMHLAWSEDGEAFHPLRNNTGILFAHAAYDEGNPKGTTKTLIDPWLFRKGDGSFGVCAVRCNQNAPDRKTKGSIMLFSSPDLVHYTEEGFLKVSEKSLRHPKCIYSPERCSYRLEWEEEKGIRCGWTENLKEIREISAREETSVRSCRDFGIPGCVPGNILEIQDDELRVIRDYLDVIEHVSVRLPEMKIRRGTVLRPEDLPKAVCCYSDGSEHAKRVDWNLEQLKEIPADKPGVYTVQGRIRRSPWRFPMKLSFGGMNAWDINDPEMHTGMSDPCVTWYRGKYYLSSSGREHIVLRCADRIEDVFGADPVIVADLKLPVGETFRGTWAAELHEIGGRLCMLTATCPGGIWTKVFSVVLICNGDPLDRKAWSEPYTMVRADGRRLQEEGITLDMTYFQDAGRDYVMWSDRRITMQGGEQVIEPADIRIAVIDPEKPWQIISPITRVIRPDFGWDRMETEVDEAPYMIRNGDDLLVTFSGSSTGMADLYDVGLLRAKSGENLLDPDAWEVIGYPLLTKESVPNEFGPGHNNFVVDRESGDIVMSYHAVPHDAQGRTLHRQPGLRRLHWAKTGLPYLEMTPERDLAPELEQVTLSVTVE